MKTLYRKYRPLKITDVVGQDHITSVLATAIKNNTPAHAYIFCGPRGTGKTSVARIFAHEINQFAYTLEDYYVDIIEIDAASNTSVENIRDLTEKIAIAPTDGRYKVYIIDEVHMLSKSAFNALLKTFEEPPAHAIFILATTDPEKIPVTILSRAQVFTFHLAAPAVMIAHLKSIAEKEGIKITDDALALVVKRGGGSFRDTLSLLDQVATLSSDTITKDLIESALGLPSSEIIAKIYAALPAAIAATSSPTAGAGDPAVSAVVALLRDLINAGKKPTAIAADLIDLILENLNPAYFYLIDRLAAVSDPFSEAKLTVALLSKKA